MVTVPDCADTFPDIGDYGPPEGHSATELATHDYDGTYGASLGSLAVRTCRRCAAIVDAAGTERHDAWHRMIEAAVDVALVAGYQYSEGRDAGYRDAVAAQAAPRWPEGAPW